MIHHDSIRLTYTPSCERPPEYLMLLLYLSISNSSSITPLDPSLMRWLYGGLEEVTVAFSNG